MADSVNNNSIDNGYKYYNTEISKFDTDNDGQISVFEVNQIKDEESQKELALLLQNDSPENNGNEITDENISLLEDNLSKAKDNQGVIGSLWNGIKSITGLGSSTKKCEQALADYKNGKITFDEADSIISGFESKQKSSVNLVSNILTGVAATLVVGSAVLTGGLSLGVVAGAAAVGGATKAGLKFLDRATNKVEGDAADAKQIIKDSLSGAIDGAVSVATAGMGTAAVTGKTVAEQTLKETVKQGIISGAKAGAVSGAVTGAGDYTIEAALEEDVDFNAADLAKSTLMNAAGGAVAGGVMGGIASGVQYNKASKAINTEALTDDIPETAIDTAKSDSASLNSEPEVIPASEDLLEIPAESTQISATHGEEAADIADELPVLKEAPKEPEIPSQIQEELASQTDRIHEIYEHYIDEAGNQIKQEFSGLDSVQETNISYRPKGIKSVLAKLTKKFKNGKLPSTSTDDCLNAIGDAYGTRIQINSLDPQETKKLIEDCLYGYDISYDDFVSYLSGDTSGLDKSGIAVIEDIKDTVIDLLKEHQSQEVVDRLVEAIGNGRLTITELNNYGDNISSYFTAKQLQDIADAYYVATNEKLKIVSLDNFHNASGSKVTLDSSYDYTVDLVTDGAVKDSGYASSQFNVKHKFADGTIGNGELQIRGTELNSFADVEHIPYDIRSGKITAGDTKYSDIYKIIQGMSEDSYKAYNEFLTQTYQYLRLKELGIEITPPVFQDASLSQEAIKLLSPEGLIEISARKS